MDAKAGVQWWLEGKIGSQKQGFISLFSTVEKMHPLHRSLLGKPDYLAVLESPFSRLSLAAADMDAAAKVGEANSCNICVGNSV
jgi:hypothetical protein